MASSFFSSLKTKYSYFMVKHLRFIVGKLLTPDSRSGKAKIDNGPTGRDAPPD
jgi:hypothetical protein